MPRKYRNRNLTKDEMIYKQSLSADNLRLFMSCIGKGLKYDFRLVIL